MHVNSHEFMAKIIELSFSYMKKHSKTDASQFFQFQTETEMETETETET
jgi:hypothetical protein